MRTPFEGLHGNKPTPQFVLFGERVLARHTSTEPVNRINSRFQFRIWPGMRNNSAECFIVQSYQKVATAEQMDSVIECRGDW